MLANGAALDGIPHSMSLRMIWKILNDQKSGQVGNSSVRACCKFKSPPGKDYSNPRQSDFYDLHKPEEDMYDRTKVPRMPWWVHLHLVRRLDDPELYQA